MFLKTLKLTNFRNYQDLSFVFKKKITVLVGDNAQGKTNFLESTFFLATSKSFKAEKEEELLKTNETVLRVAGEIENGTSLEIIMQQNEDFLAKRIKVNGIPRKVSDYTNQLVVVLFAPEDINLVTGSPSLRRSYIDSVLSQIDRSYKKSLSSYESIITNKNKLLKKIREGFARKDELTFWVDQQILLGTLLTEKRTEFFNFLNITEKKLGNSGFEYLPNILSLDRLNEYQQKEIDSANSLIGPHRDDFRFLKLPPNTGYTSSTDLTDFTGLDLSKYGSRGEQRTAVLDLKILELEYIQSKISDRPVLLLDDIFSELDVSHRQHVIDLSKKQQTIITTVEWDNYLEKALIDAHIFEVKNGDIQKK